MARELQELRREYRRDGQAFPLRLESLRLLAVSHYQGLSRIDADAPVDNALLMTYATAAKRLCISESSLYRLIKSGELPTVRIGKSSRITEEDLRAYVEGLPRERLSA
jgi:excisionase family DNA binding protein